MVHASTFPILHRHRQSIKLQPNQNIGDYILNKCETVKRCLSPFTILQTKLHRPPLASDVVYRKTLHDQLDASRDLPLTLVSASAGSGKSTLISQWLEERGHPAACISLDESDSGLRMFLSYIMVSVRTFFPVAARETKSFLMYFKKIEDMRKQLNRGVYQLPAGRTPVALWAPCVHSAENPGSLQVQDTASLGRSFDTFFRFGG